MQRREFAVRLGALGAAALGAGPPGPAAAQAFSTARLLLGAPAGGAGDSLARRMADKMRNGYAASVIVENKPGAAGQLAILAAREAPADGSTLLMTPSSFFSIYPHIYTRLQYRTEDFAPVSLLAYTNFGLAVGPLVPASVQDLRGFLQWCKANPDRATYGSPAAGSIAHLIPAAVGKLNAVELRHVPYRGSVPGLQDLRGGQIAAMSSPLGALLPHLGAVRVLAVSGTQRSSLMPTVPTYREQGQRITGREWYGVFLPAAATPQVVTRAAAYLKIALAQADVAEGARQLGLEVATSTPQELAEMIRSDSAEWRVLIKRIGFTAES